jgi:trans-aconitate methyltransferase
MEQDYSYDRVMYPSFVFPATGPERLATEAVFCGMETAAPAKCRYLELGCGDGANLLLHASEWPNSEFTGIDLSGPRIEEAKSYARQLQLENVTFHHADITSFRSADLGEFDFIVAHGLYSWVPENVREKIRELYSECLAPRGVGYISYNAFPGCHIREMLWGMIRFHTASISDPKTKIERSIQLLNAIKELTPHAIYREMIASEVKEMTSRVFGSIYHDDLSGSNQPFYLHEFVRDIEPYGLKYICDVRPLSVSGIDKPPKVEEIVGKFSTDSIDIEQYTDFFMWTRFRNSLVCRTAQHFDRKPSFETLQRFRFYADAKPVSPAPVLDDGVPESFSMAQGTIEFDDFVIKRALVRLSKINPHCLAFDELLEFISEGIDDRRNDEIIQKLLRYVNIGLLRIRMYEPPFTDNPGEFPCASTFARWQAEKGYNPITSLSGLNLTLEHPGMAVLLSKLDGTRNRANLYEEMSEYYEVPEGEEDKFALEFPRMIDAQLDRLGKLAFLVH